MSTLLGTLLVLLIFGGVPLGLAAVALAVVHRNEVEDPARFRDPARRTGNTATALGGVVAGVLLWAVWISWGNFEYPTWAIVGCVLTSLVVVTGLGFLSRWRWTGPFVGALGGLAGFSTVCGIQMGGDDTTGLWGVGYLILVVCGGFVLTLVALVIMLVRMPRLPRTPTMGRP